jgi:superfamily I DNA/RNA helicase
MDTVLDTYYMWSSRYQNVRDPFIGSFKDFSEMKEYGDSLDDKEIKSLVKVVEEYKHDIPRLIEEIKRRAVPNLTGREVVLSTTHKAKGMEWMDVVLTNDFTDLVIAKDEKGNEVGPEPEEINILYVACTRAIRGIQLPEAVSDWIIRTNRGDLLGFYGRQQEEVTESNLVKWRLDMAVYLDKVRDSFVSSPAEAAEIARFLVDQSKKFQA